MTRKITNVALMFMLIIFPTALTPAQARAGGDEAAAPSNRAPQLEPDLVITTPATQGRDSFYGTGVYKSTDAGSTWQIVGTCNTARGCEALKDACQSLRNHSFEATAADRSLGMCLTPAGSANKQPDKTPSADLSLAAPKKTSEATLNCHGTAVCRKVKNICGALGGTYRPVNDLSGSCQHGAAAKAVSTTPTERASRPAGEPQGTAPPAQRKPTANTAATQELSAGEQPTLDRQAFEDSLNAAVAPKVMGYTFLLIKDGRVAAEGAGGLARNAADGKMNMTTSTPQNMGSLFKFVTGVTMLHLLDQRPAGSAGGSNSFQTVLGAQVALLYPQLWNAGIKTPGIRSITFRHLLQHRSGFRDCSTPLGCFGGAYDLTLLGKREYENINFSLLGYLIPLYATPSLLPELNGVPHSVPATERDADMQLVLGDRMFGFMRQTVFPLAPGKISASCDAANEYKTTGAYGYVSKTDTGKGIITSRKAANKPCSGAGGNWMSIRDFGAFVATALHSDKMLSQQARREMYRDGMAPDDRLVWSFTTSDSWISDKFKMSSIIWSNGIQPYDGGQSFNTVLLRLPLNYELMVFVNSGGMNVNSLASAGLKAFRAGMEHNFQ